MRKHNWRMATLRWGLLLLAAVWLTTESYAQSRATRDSRLNRLPANQGILPDHLRDRLQTGSSTSGAGLRSSSSSSRSRSTAARRSSSQARTAAGTAATGSAAASNSATEGSAPAAAAAAGAIPDAARKTTVVRRTTDSRAGSGRRAGSSSTLPGFQILPGMKSNAIYLTPSRLEVREGEEFATTIEFYNTDEVDVTAVDIWISYRPGVVEPVWIDLEPLEGHLGGPLEPRVWRDQGFIRLQAELTEPLTQAVEAIARIHWRAVTPTPGTRIELTAPVGEDVAVWTGQTNLVEPSNIGNEARVSADVVIQPRSAGEQALRMVDDVRRSLGVADELAPSRVRLAIVPNKDMVAPGEVSTADIVLINPDNEPIDHLKLRLRYDPRSVKILDADYNNYITAGINIFDGDFHGQFPFDLQIANNVDPRFGVIRYEMATQSAETVYPSGTLARIVFRMQREAGTVSFWFERVDPALGVVATDVSLQGRSLLARTDEAAMEALHGARIQVEPLDLLARN